MLRQALAHAADLLQHLQGLSPASLGDYLPEAFLRSLQVAPGERRAHVHERSEQGEAQQPEVLVDHHHGRGLAQPRVGTQPELASVGWQDVVHDAVVLPLVDTSTVTSLHDPAL